MGITQIDFWIIAIYFIALIAFGAFLYRRENAEGFFVNSRKTKLFLLLFTTISTSVGAGTVIGMASAAYSSGISLGLTFAVISLIGWTVMGLISPKIKATSDKIAAFTMGDYFKDRFSVRTQRVASFVILVSTLIVASVQFVAFGTLASVIGGVNFHVALAASAIIVILYTIMAGLKGDFYTDALQVFVMLPVFVTLLFIGFQHVSPMQLVSDIPAEFLSPFNYAGPLFFLFGLLFGIPLIFTSMDVWQRVYAAVDGATAKRAFFCAGVLKVVFISASVILGLMAVLLLPNVEPDAALYLLMRTYLPSGLLGLGFASILAILMSSIDSILMVGSATITKDFYAPWKGGDDQKLLSVGRWSVLILGVVAFLIALSFQSIVDLIVIGAQIPLIFAPAILGGLFWKRAGERAAFWSILLGFGATLGGMAYSIDFSFIPGVFTSVIVFCFLTWCRPKTFGQP